MAGSALPNIDYYFREERLRDEGGERTYARLVGDLTAARAGGLLCDFRVRRGFSGTGGRERRTKASS
jgi:hypothetical protein